MKNLELDCQRLKAALISNKEDTSVVIKEISEVQQELENLQELISFYKKEVKRRITKGNFFLPLSFISGISLAAGSFLIYKGVTTDNNTLATSGYILTGGGAIGFFTLQFTWRIE